MAGSLKSIKVCGTGSRGVIVDKLDMSKKDKYIEWRVPTSVKASRLYYKVLTDPCSYKSDIDSAYILNKYVDPDQKYFVYPLTFYKQGSDKDLLNYVNSHNHVPHKQFNTAAPVMYIEVIPQAGRSLAKLDDDGVRFTPKQGKDVINKLVAGLVLLHTKKFKHGDIQKHNIVVDISPSGQADARFIDFGEMEMVTDGDFQFDTKGMIAVIHQIIRMTDHETHDDYEHFDKMSMAIKGAPPMSAHGISTQLRSSVMPSRVRRRSSSSKSANSSSKSASPKKTLMF